MEPLIEKTDRTIWAEQWRQARVRIDQTALQRNLDSIRRITSDFVQESSAWGSSREVGGITHDDYQLLCGQYCSTDSRSLQ